MENLVTRRPRYLLLWVVVVQLGISVEFTGGACGGRRGGFGGFGFLPVFQQRLPAPVPVPVLAPVPVPVPVPMPAPAPAPINIVININTPGPAPPTLRPRDHYGYEYYYEYLTAKDMPDQNEDNSDDDAVPSPPRIPRKRLVKAAKYRNRPAEQVNDVDQNDDEDLTTTTTTINTTARPLTTVTRPLTTLTVRKITTQKKKSKLSTTFPQAPRRPSPQKRKGPSPIIPRLLVSEATGNVTNPKPEQWMCWLLPGGCAAK